MRSYQKWPIYATKRMVEIIPQLCLRGEKHTVVANVMFHCLGSSDSDSDYNSLFQNDYMETLNHLFNNHMKVDTNTNSYKGVKELVFSPFNLKLINEVSPSIYSSQRDHLIFSLEESLKNFSMYYTNVKENIDPNSLYYSVGTDFVKIIKILRLHHKIQELSSDVINDYFKHSLNTSQFHIALELLEMILGNKQLDLCTPLVPGSIRLADILVGVVKCESSSFLELFYKIIPNELHDQCLQFLRTTNPNTGLLIYDWGYNESELILRNKPSGDSRRLHLPRLKSNDSTYDNPILDKMIVNNIASLYSAFQTFKELSKTTGLTENDYLHKSFKNNISVHFEPDLLVISTHKEIFITDLLIRDSLYKSSLYNLLNFIWSSNLTKIGHNIMLNMAKLSCQFVEAFKKYNMIVDLNDKRVKKVKQYKDDGIHETNQFRSTGMTKSLNGLLQEYNVGVPARKSWNNIRPIPIDRVKYLSVVSRGILSIEYQLRSQGWMPSSICDTSFKETNYAHISLPHSEIDQITCDLGSNNTHTPSNRNTSEENDIYIKK